MSTASCPGEVRLGFFDFLSRQSPGVKVSKNNHIQAAIVGVVSRQQTKVNYLK